MVGRIELEARPQPALGFRKVGAQALGVPSSFGVPLHTPPSPCPLPLKGARGKLVRHGRISIPESVPVNA